MNSYQVKDTLVNVREQGNGEHVLFLHGVPDSSDVWVDTMLALRGEYRCVAPDLPGFGRTRATADFDYSLDNLAAFVNELLLAMAINEPVHLVIHDIGGIVGLAFATRFPHKVRSLNIMDTTFFSDHQWHKLAAIWRKPYIGWMAMHLMNYKRFAQSMLKTIKNTDEKLLKQQYQWLTRSNRNLILKCYRTLDPSQFTHWEKQLPSLTKQVPTQVIWGRRDPFLSPELAERFSAQQVTIVPDVGHWPMLDAPELVQKLLMQHLRACS